MRIIAGQFKGRPLQSPRGDSTRPTSGRIRDALMQMLASRRLQDGTSIPADQPLAGMYVLDLFCGSGALGLEAVSRGAIHASFVDTSSEAIRTTSANIQNLGLTTSTLVLRGKLPAALRRLPNTPVDLVFADPPYAFRHFETVLAELVSRDLLAPGALVVYEHAAGATAPTHPALPCEPLRSWGDTAMTLYTCPEEHTDARPTPTSPPSTA